MGSESSSTRRLFMVAGMMLLVFGLSMATLLSNAGRAAAATPTAASEHLTFISMASEAAKASQQKYGVPVAVTVAQAILESGWGTSELTRSTKNYFGIKCPKDAANILVITCADSPTIECSKEKGCYPTTAEFRVYNSAADSFSDHGHVLHEFSRYASAFKFSDNPDQFIREVHKAGYATDPEYSDKVIELMKQYDLYRFTKAEHK